MSKYYKPTKAELLSTPDLVLEFYTPDEDVKWHEFTYDPNRHMDVDLDDLRVRYVESEDFDALGYNLQKIFIKTIEQVKEILVDGTEVMEEVDVFEEEVLTIFKNGSLKPFGTFYPYRPTNNVALREGDMCYDIRNATELKKLLT